MDNQMMQPPPFAPQEGPPPMAGEAPQQGAQPLELMEELDADIATGFLVGLTKTPEAERVISDAMKAQNPAPALGIFLSTLVDKLSKKFDEQGMPISPNVWLSEGGAVDRVLDELTQGDEQLASMVTAEMIDQLKLASQAEANGAQQAPPPMMGQPQMGGPPPMMQGGV